MLFFYSNMNSNFESLTIALVCCQWPILKLCCFCSLYFFYRWWSCNRRCSSHCIMVTIKWKSGSILLSLHVSNHYRMHMEGYNPKSMVQTIITIIQTYCCNIASWHMALRNENKSTDTVTVLNLHYNTTSHHIMWLYDMIRIYVHYTL